MTPVSPSEQLTRTEKKAQKPRRTPVRTCVACRTSGGKRGLLRVVRLPDAAGVELDPTGKRNGRGAYLCPTEECVSAALKRKALERSLKLTTPIPPETAESLHRAVKTADAVSSASSASSAGESPPQKSAPT